MEMSDIATIALLGVALFGIYVAVEWVCNDYLSRQAVDQAVLQDDD